MIPIVYISVVNLSIVVFNFVPPNYYFIRRIERMVDLKLVV